jgi:hypothetical protein
MDPAQHDRFLEYLERFEYFGRGDAVRLGRDEFAVVDAEYQRLAALDRRDAGEEETFRAFRAVLLKD